MLPKCCITCLHWKVSAFGDHQAEIQLIWDTGANEVFQGLETGESKVAFLIHAIGLQLYKADKELNPTACLSVPNLIKDHC